MKALLRRYEGSIKALLRRYKGAIKDLPAEVFSGSKSKAFLFRSQTSSHAGAANGRIAPFRAAATNGSKPAVPAKALVSFLLRLD